MFPGGSGYGNDVTVNINGSAMGLVDALRVSSDQFLQTAQSSEALASSFIALGAAGEDSAAAFSAAGGAAMELGGRYDALAAQARMAADAQAQMAGIIGGGGASMGGGMGGGGGGFFGGSFMGAVGGGLTSLMGGLGDVIEGAASKMMGFVTQAGSMLAGLASFSVLNEVIQEVQGFADSLIELNKATEKNVYSWKYLYGGMGNANEIAAWTKQFSMQIPYTRQSLLDAVTNLAPLGLSVAGLEHYMPMIADLGATRAPNLDIAQVAQVIMSASMGYTRMLKYDLKINPEDLIQYGLNATGRGIGMHINDPSTLLPALENYAKAKGLTGAAKDIAHNTFWGAWSSFIDRIQNFELDTGHGLFGSLKTALNDLSSWIDTHSAQIARFSDLIGSTLANAFKMVSGVIGDVMTGLGQSGLLDAFNVAVGISTNGGGASGAQTSGYGSTHAGSTVLGHLGGYAPHEGARGKATTSGAARLGELTAPPDPSGWQIAGQIIGGALQAIGQGWAQISAALSPGIADLIKQLGDAFQQLGQNLTPDDIEGLKRIGGFLLAVPWFTLAGAIGLLTAGVNFLTWALKNIIHPFQDFLDHLGKVNDGVGEIPTKLGQLKDKLAQVGGQFTTWIGGLKTQALGWGLDLMANLMKGISAAMPSLDGTLSNVAEHISSFLHHSKPERGPLANDDQWMPDMMRLFAEGIRGHTSLVTSAMSDVAAAMAGALGGGGRGAGRYGGGYGAPVIGGAPTIVIHASSTVEVLRLIDYALSKQGHGINLASRASGGTSYYTFGTLGGH